MDHGQTTYKNGTLTYNFQQHVQETNSLIYNKQPKKPVCCRLDLQEARLLSGDNPRKLNNNFYNSQLNMAWTWLVTDSFRSFCSHFELSTNQRKLIYIPNQL